MPTLAWIAVLGVAGALGAVARFGVVEWGAHHWPNHFPLATLVVNVCGAFALGFVMTVGATTGSWRLVLGTGFLGGYTTFSTLSFETHSLARRGHLRDAWLNAAGSLVAGIVAAALGITLGIALASAIP